MMTKRLYSDFPEMDTIIKKKHTPIQQFNTPYRSEYLHKIEGSKVYLVQTRFEPELVKEILSDPEYFVILYDKEGNDSCRHLVLLDDQRLNTLYSEKWPYIMYRPYDIDIEKNLPNPSNCETLKFFIKLPYGKYPQIDYSRYPSKYIQDQSKYTSHTDQSKYNPLKSKYPVIDHSKYTPHVDQTRSTPTYTADMYRKYINDKLTLYAKYGVIPDRSWTLEIPIINNKVGSPIVGHCIVEFDLNVSVESIAMARVLLDHDSWPHTGKKIQCNWQHTRSTKFKHFTQVPRAYSSSWRQPLARTELMRTRSRSF